MFILNFLNKLIHNLQDENIPQEGRIALAIFILSLVLLVSYLNTMVYFIILISLGSETIQNWINQQDYIRKIVNIYKNTRIAFLVFEICLSLFIILFLLYYSHLIYTHFIR